MLHKQLFSALEGGKEGPEVKLYETFHLSAQYDAPAVFGAYKNSMLLELKEYSPMLHSMLKSAELSFEAEPALEDIEADCADDMGHVIVSGEQLQTGKAVSADFSINVPVLTSHNTVARNAEELTFDMILEHAELSQTIGVDQCGAKK